MRARFYIDFENIKGYDVLANTDMDTIDISVDLYWTGIPEGKAINYELSENTVKTLYAKPQYDEYAKGGTGVAKMYLGINGLDILNAGDEIVATPMVKSVTGVGMTVQLGTYTVK